VRLALGANRGVIFRQLLTENIGLAFLGAVGGGLLALWGVNLLRGMSPPGTPRLDEVVVNGRALLFATGLAVITGLLFGLVPAIQASSTNLTKSLKESSGLRTSGAKHRTRSALVVVETAIALTLLVGAGLMMRSFIRLGAVDPGFRAENTLSVDLLPPTVRYPEPAQLLSFYQGLFDRLETRPGVVAAGGTSIAPLSGRNTDTGLVIEGKPLPRDREETPIAWYRSVTPDYFRAIGMRVLKGRGISEDDRADAPPVAVINETMAKRFWPGEDPIGRRISSEGSEGPWTTIVGIVADVYHNGPDQPALVEMYLPYPQLPARLMTVVLRTADADPMAVLPAVRSAVSQIDPALPLSRVTTMQQQLSDSMSLPRLFVSFFGFFALIALSLAAIGIYGITSFAVDQRKQEIGVRMALGAQAGDVEKLILRHAAQLAALGLTLGVAATLALSSTIKALLFDMSPTDPLTYLVIIITLGAVSIVAGWIPARRATQVDPIKTLRTD
jgi:putative ABC transport system permease protein